MRKAGFPLRKAGKQETCARSLTRLGVSVLIAMVLLLSTPAVCEENPGTAAGGDAHRLRWVVAACDTEDWPTVSLALIDPSPTVRLLAVTCWDADTAGLEAPRSAVADRDPAVRRAAACLFATHGAVSEVEAFVSDTDTHVRSTAVACLPSRYDAEIAALVRKTLSGDPEPDVLAAAARWLTNSGAVEALTGEERELVALGLEWAALRDTAPELAGGLEALRNGVARVRQWIEERSLESDACAQTALVGLNGLAEELADADLFVDDKSADPWDQLVASRRRLAAAMQSYYACLSATPLDFSAYGFFGGAHGRTLSAVGEMGMAWDINFGPLRADIEKVDRGELWTRFEMGMNAYLPGRSVGDSTPRSTALAAGVRARRDQLFVNEQLSRWNGGGFLRFHLPFPEGGRRAHRLRATLFGVRSTGDNGDYPHMLVTPHDRLGANTDLTLRLTDSMNMGFEVSADRVRYDVSQLRAAGADELSAGLELDASYQLHIDGVWRQYAATGPTHGHAAIAGATNRDGALLSTLTGVRFRGPGDLDFLELFVLGGVGLPLLPEFEPALNPQVLFDLHLSMSPRQMSGEYFSLTIGGRRRFDFSPRNFAVQTVVESFIELAGGNLGAGPRGFEGAFRTYYSLTDHLGAMTSELEQRYNVVGGHVGIRFYVVDWLGFHIYDQIDAVKLLDRDFDVNNRFLVSLFVPMGGYAFDREEPLPW